MKANKILLIIQICLMYISLIFIFISELGILNNYDIPAEVLKAFLISGIALGGIASCISIAIFIISFIHIFKRDVIDMTKIVMVIKIVSIPWYIGNFILWALLVMGMLNPFLLLAIPLVIALSVMVTYVDMIATSSCNLSYLISSFRCKKLKPSPLMIVGMAFEFIFCLDFIGAIFIYVDNKKKKELTNEKAF